MRHLGRMGKIVYLKLNIHEIERRLSNLASRGVAGAKEKTIAQIFDERRPLYEKYADYVVECDGGSVAENALKIVDLAKNDIIESRS